MYNNSDVGNMTWFFKYKNYCFFLCVSYW